MRFSQEIKQFLSYSDSEVYKQINIFYIYIKYLINFEKMGKCKKYNKITYEKRLQLISMVCNQSISYKVACKKLNICISTAKIIVKKYREDGQIF